MIILTAILLIVKILLGLHLNIKNKIENKLN